MQSGDGFKGEPAAQVLLVQLEQETAEGDVAGDEVAPDRNVNERHLFKFNVIVLNHVIECWMTCSVWRRRLFLFDLGKINKTKNGNLPLNWLFYSCSHPTSTSSHRARAQCCLLSASPDNVRLECVFWHRPAQSLAWFCRLYEKCVNICSSLAGTTCDCNWQWIRLWIVADELFGFV